MPPRSGPRATAGENAPTPLVAIHGGGYDNAAISWFHLYQAVTDRPVIGLDLPGFGGSIDAPPVGGPVAMAALVAEVIDLLGLRPAVVLGCSMGGDVALQLALDHPEHVAGLVLVGPGGLAPRVGGRALHATTWALGRLPDPLFHTLARSFRFAARRVARAMVHDLAAVDPRPIEHFVEEADDPRSGMGFGRYNQAVVDRGGLSNDKSARVAEIPVPTVFFHGQFDRHVSPDDSLRAATRMPHARCVLVPGAGHLAQVEAPQQFAHEVRTLVEQVEDAPRP